MIFANNTCAYLYVEAFNSIYPSIQIPEYVISNKSVNFLDVTIFVTTPHDDGTYHIHTKLFTKPCSKFIYLHPHSNHRPHIFKNWIKNEISRMRLVCSLDSDFKQCTDLFAKHLLLRGYTTQFISPLFAIPLDRNRLLYHHAVHKAHKKNNHIAFITSSSPTIHNIIHTPDILTLAPSPEVRDTIAQEIFANKPLILYKNSPNILQLLSGMKKV